MIRRFDFFDGHHPHLLLAIAVIALTVCAASAGERQHCLRAEIDEIFMLPNGSVHPPAELRLCLTRSLSPVSGAHQTHVDGHSVGYFMSVKTDVTDQAPDSTAGPYFEFARNEHGELELRGYAWTDGTTVLAYDLTRLNKRKFKYRVTTREEHVAGAAAPQPDGREDSIIRLAAARH
jgi:hypothetical protein